ncbi:hypothetical protein O181_105362 [Austropuccinia psidii MF-1]|uniref:Uncharacterized protein n=1 Tax=Austropuccinia psidii MF-1 TaxID=1389203 RepID=A0A9Q3JND5_9BASI|nr:hypothetical protein [Austropuccinia psidii MF-1]
MSLKAQTHFNTIYNVWVITPHGATQQFGIRRLLPHHLHAYAPTPPPDETLKLHPELGPHHYLRFYTPQLTIFTLLKPPQDETRMPPSPLPTLPHPRLIFSLAYNPYAAEGASSYASDTALTPPYASLHPPNRICFLPSLCLWSAFPTCLKSCLPSLHLWSAFLTFLQRHLPSLCLWSSFPTCLQHRLPSLHSYSALPRRLPSLCSYSALSTCL